MQTRKRFINEEQTFLIIWADFITNVLTPNNQITVARPLRGRLEPKHLYAYANWEQG